ncbi:MULTISPECIES: peroxiredoxin family protein [Rufibacter]|uniref:Peroxiredoxin n=1 Tax=Rufibacter quisquiliarum TaxID=1549639 RepID=A0A839GGT5_9BACT|nr:MULTISPECIES: redoxin domain-containing protein [Rufibacter]MBA9075879.1 peroxiredoxin [Rufibacter quisquiliarum]
MLEFSKKLLTALVLTLLLSYSAWAQKTVTISGKINKPISDSVLLEIYTVPASYTGESHTTALSKSGDFTITAPLAEPMLAELVHGSESIMLFLQPGDNLDVKVNADDFIYSIKFKGKGTNENAYLLQYERKFEEEEDYQVLPDNVHKREKEFLQFLEERRQDQRDFLEKFTKSSPVSEAFMQYAQAQIEFSYANDRLTYPEVRKRVGGLPPQLSSSYYGYLKEIDLNKAGAVRNQAYLDFLVNYFQHKALSDRRGNPERDYYPIMYNMVKQELKGPAREMMMSRILSQSIKFGYVPDTDAMYRDFQQEARIPQFISYVKGQYQQFRKVGMGSAAPNFTLLSSTGDSVSLSSLKGKIVYLGFWRAACGICTVDQQAYKFFAEQLAPKDVVLVQVSVGEELEAWKQKVAQKPIPALQLHLASPSAKLVKDYDLKTFPSYYLIDPNGNIISSNARRPGHAEGAREIAALIDQYRLTQTQAKGK